MSHDKATQCSLQLLSKAERAQNEAARLSSESVLDILKLIFTGSPLPEVLLSYV
jgi:hypothetical protein